MSHVAFGDLTIAELEPWLRATTRPCLLVRTGLWPDEDVVEENVASVLEEFGIAPSRQLRFSVDDFADEHGAVRLVAAFAAGGPWGIRGRIFVMPGSEGATPQHVELDGSACEVARVSLERFVAASLASERGDPLPDPRPKARPARRPAAAAAQVTVRKLRPADYDREFPRARGYPPAGAFPEATGSRPAAGGFLGISPSGAVWLYLDGVAREVPALVAAGPMRSEVGPDAWWVVRDDGALVRIDPETGRTDVRGGPAVHDVCLGPPGRLITMGRDAVLRLVADEDPSRVVAELPYRDEPFDQVFPSPQHRVQSLPGGRAGLLLAFDRGRVFGVVGDQFGYLEADESVGLTGMDARTDVLVANGPRGRIHVYGGAALSATPAVPVTLFPFTPSTTQEPR